MLAQFGIDYIQDKTCAFTKADIFVIYEKLGAQKAALCNVYVMMTVISKQLMKFQKDKVALTFYEKVN